MDYCQPCVQYLSCRLLPSMCQYLYSGQWKITHECPTMLPSIDELPVWMQIACGIRPVQTIRVHCLFLSTRANTTNVYTTNVCTCTHLCVHHSVCMHTPITHESYIEPTLHVHFRYTAGALQFDLGKHSTGNVFLEMLTVDGIFFFTFPVTRLPPTESQKILRPSRCGLF